MQSKFEGAALPLRTLRGQSTRGSDLRGTYGAPTMAAILSWALCASSGHRPLQRCVPVDLLPCTHKPRPLASHGFQFLSRETLQTAGLI